MKKLLIALLGLALVCPNSYAQLWINEVSYAMTGTDSDDFIEIVGPVGADLSDYGVMLVNGTDSSNYDYKQLEGTITSVNSNSGLGFFVVLSNQSSSITIPAGVDSMMGDFISIQNGPDGVLLINHSTQEAIHGVWYKDDGNSPISITRSGSGNPPGDGPYSMSNVDLITAEDLSNSDSGFGVGMDGGGFSQNWVYQISTPGNLNQSQSSLPLTLIDFKLQTIDGGINVYWKTIAESNIERFVLTKTDDYGFELSFWEINAKGKTQAIQKYNVEDDAIRAGRFYYSLFEVNSNGVKTLLKTIATVNNVIGEDVLFDINSMSFLFPNKISGVFFVSIYSLNGMLMGRKEERLTNDFSLGIPLEWSGFHGPVIIEISGGGMDIGKKSITMF
jgi:hypothetical protein